jgi:hypothetical protein
MSQTLLITLDTKRKRLDGVIAQTRIDQAVGNAHEKYEPDLVDYAGYQT